MSLKKPLKILLFSTLGVLLLLLLTNFIVNFILSREVEAILADQRIQHYRISAKKVRFSIFDRSILVRELTLQPTDTAMLRLRSNSFEKNALNVISCTSIKFKGIDILSVLQDRNIVVRELLVRDLLVQRFKNNSPGKVGQTGNSAKSIKPDSIFLEGISGFELKNIRFRNMQVHLVDASTGDLTFKNHPFNFEISGFKLVPKGGSYFSVSPVKDNFKIENIRIEIPDKQYSFSIGKITFDFKKDHICIDELSLRPSVKASYLASTYRYNSEVYDFKMEKCCLHQLDIEKAESGNGIFLDSISISGLDLHIFKDKKKPFDISKRPALPHNALKKMKFPLLVPKLTITGGSLRYEEDLRHENLNMEVRMENLNVSVENLTSLEKYRQDPMKIDLKAEFMNKGMFDLHLSFPLKDDEDLFDFYGSLQGSEFKYFDDAIIPALGIKVLNGHLDQLTFQARASSNSSEGTMTMLYRDMEAEVFKFKSASHEKSGFLTYSVNNLIHRSNPDKDGNVRVAVMNFDRVPYKGLGNYLWKTLQHGIMNTISPFGMTQEKAEAKKKRKEKRAMRRRERKSRS